MSKRMVTYKVGDADKIVSIDDHEVGSGGVGNKSISRRMITYKVDDAGKITSIDGHELGGGGGGDYEIKALEVTENGVYDVAGEAYKPVRVNVPQTAQSGTLKAVLDATKSTYYLFNMYNGTSVEGLISFSDTSNVNSMGYMFYNCKKLTSIPRLDSHKVTFMSFMFYGCAKLTSIPQLDVSNVVHMDYIFSDCYSLTSIGLYAFRVSIDISQTALEHDALVAFLNQAGTAYDSSQKITMGSAKLALLSDEEKAIATNKGWTLA